MIMHTMIKISILIGACLLAANAAALEDRVSLQAVRSMDGAQVDTLYFGHEHQFQVMIENSFVLFQFSLGFAIYSDSNTSLEWNAQPDGYPEDGQRAITVIPDSRLDSVNIDVGQVRIGFIDGSLDEQLPDSMAVIPWYGFDLPIGPMEPMMAFHFTPIQNFPDEVGELCLDWTWAGSEFVFFFYDQWMYYTPEFDRPFCWPVKEFEPMLGDFNYDWQISVGDIVAMIQHIFGGVPHVAPVGSGDVNCDGQMNVGDAIYLIAHIFRFGPAPGCP